MTTFLYRGTGTALPSVVPPMLPPPRAAGPSRAMVWGSAAALLVALSAAVITGVAWVSSSTSRANTVVVPWSPPAPSADQIAKARSKTCAAWAVTVPAMDDATNAVAHAPADWNDAATQEALAHEARVILVESAYLRHEMPSETPEAIRSGINDYLAASFDMENATVHRKGTARNEAIGRANAAEAKVNAACR
ncbi:hypothetical protein LAUMK4_05899 [Mycobacterium persicum]|uniref:Uncharacterized protein n=2 Tax=Mycobacterium persicum TaxID=1487726 RepID=A0ABY6RTD9_9MYCO|nr:hypothetical protein LAUMK4_05899 [Mycobacterium persicum]